MDKNIHQLNIQSNNRPLQYKYKYNNGSFGFGASGAMFPETINGPFGTVNYPLPDKDQKMVNYQSYQFNSKNGQFPKYNEETFLWRSRFSKDPKEIASGLGITSFNLKT